MSSTKFADFKIFDLRVPFINALHPADPPYPPHPPILVFIHYTNMETESEELAFRLSLLTFIAGFLTFVVRAALKSNCVEFNACGISCKRDHSNNPGDLEIQVVK